jgi:hypothetical protein
VAGVRALLILLAGQAMATMDQSILAVAAPSLRADLDATGMQRQLASRCRTARPTRSR